MNHSPEGSKASPPEWLNDDAKAAWTYPSVTSTACKAPRRAAGMRQRWVDERRCLIGFPHPSGGNGHRVKQFAQRRDELTAKVAGCFA
jgi:hypothetical protein